MVRSSPSQDWGEAGTGWLGLRARVRVPRAKVIGKEGPRALGPQEKWELGSSWLESPWGMETSVRRTFRKAWWEVRVLGMAGGRHKVTKRTPSQRWSLLTEPAKLEK